MCSVEHIPQLLSVTLCSSSVFSTTHPTAAISYIVFFQCVQYNTPHSCYQLHCVLPVCSVEHTPQLLSVTLCSSSVFSRTHPTAAISYIVFFQCVQYNTPHSCYQSVSVFSRTHPTVLSVTLVLPVCSVEHTPQLLSVTLCSSSSSSVFSRTHPTAAISYIVFF